MAACLNCGADDVVVDESGLCAICTAALQPCPYCGGNGATCECYEATAGGD